MHDLRFSQTCWR